MPDSVSQEAPPNIQVTESLVASQDESNPVSSGLCGMSTSPILPERAPERVQVRACNSQVWGENSSYWKTIKGLSVTNDEIHNLTVEMDKRLKSGESDFLAFDQSRSRDEGFIQIEKGPELPPIWFVGDLHGDWLGLQSALHYIDHVDKKKSKEHSIIIFLGDLFDRSNGENGAKVLFSVLKLVKERPKRIGFIVGNHDESLVRAPNGKFTSSVCPSEFADWLNDQPTESPWIGLAEIAISFFKYAPRALLLPDGLLVAHGGVPHTDLLDKIQFKHDLGKPAMLEDFVWTRLHESAKIRRPNRTTRGCSLGIRDFNLFCENVAKVLKQPILRMLRGHDHYDERYRLFGQYEERPVLTINTFCYHQDGDLPDPPARPAVIAEWQDGKMPVVHILEIPYDVVAATYSTRNPEPT